MPGGQPIGTPSPGGDETIRDVPGGQVAAQVVFDALSRGGTPYVGSYPGIAVIRSDGGFVGIRGAHTGNPTLDVNIPGLPDVSKLHFS
jgi:hypothetical protein